MRYRIVTLCGAVAVAGLMASGCATQKYVDDRVAELSAKVDGQVAAVSARVDQNSTQLAALGGQVNSMNGQLASANSSSAAAQKRAEDAYKLAQGSLNRPVLAEDDSITFDTNKWALSTDAQAKLTTMAQQLKAQDKNVFIEIVGHGDPRGSVMNNRVLGEKRALEVRRFLSAQGIPLSHMETVSWGEERTKNPNAATDDTHEENRRVNIRVLG